MTSQYQRMKNNLDKKLALLEKAGLTLDSRLKEEINRQLEYANTWDPDLADEVTKILED